MIENDGSLVKGSYIVDSHALRTAVPGTSILVLDTAAYKSDVVFFQCHS